ncbi:MAG: alpha/beta fold hydrolase [Gemmatimonadales bacterium]|nr:MAG: alpha/beta fold hydrolase [Gemmatimonadales bacterium]
MRQRRTDSLTRGDLRILVFALVAAASWPASGAAQAEAERWAGDWRGTLQAGPQELPIIFHIAAGDEGLTATMDSPAQGAYGIPMDGVDTAGDSLTLTLSAAQARYDGVMQEDGSIHGTWTQGPASLPLNLDRADPGTEVEGSDPSAVIPDPATRPQTPHPPFPYRAEEVEVPHLEEEFSLAGTLTLPEGEGPFPGAVLVSGSGPQDRDETLLGHKPFAVLADHLTRAGIAVLRYDDRGVGGSGGDFGSATSVEFASDAESAVAWMEAHPEVAPEKVGIVGHSEGGLIAPMVATERGMLAYVVLLAGPGMTGEEIILDQSRLIGEAQGVDPEQLERSLAANAALFEVVRTEKDPARAEGRLREVLRGVVAEMSPAERVQSGISDESLEGWIDGQVMQLSSPWLRFFLTYDPVPALERTRVPVLALNGEKDLQVPYEANLAAIRGALERGGNSDYTVEALPGLNHLFQEATTGAPSEYATIDETMSPAVLDRISSWIMHRFGGREQE